jgi:hypothetical protein
MDAITEKGTSGIDLYYHMSLLDYMSFRINRVMLLQTEETRRVIKSYISTLTSRPSKKEDQ